MNGASLFVSHCPLKDWESEPLTSPEAAREALRSHLNGHTHGGLVDFIANDEAWPAMVTRYVKEDQHGN